MTYESSRRRAACTALHSAPAVALRRRADRQPPHLVEEGAQADPQQVRRLAPVATRGLERAQDGLALHRLHLALEIERRRRARAVAVGARHREVARLQRTGT